jgi:hypothetical protein
MKEAEMSVAPIEDKRGALEMLGAVGPLTYLFKEGRVGDSLDMISAVVSVDACRLVLAIGGRVSRGLGVFFGIFLLAAGALISWGAYDSSKRYGADFAGVIFAAMLLGGGLLAFSFDFRRPAETLVMLDRRSGRIIAPDPSVNVARVKDLRFLTWVWADSDFAIERVVLGATGAQTFRLRAVQRNAQGELERSIVLLAMIPTMQHAEAAYEFLRRYMAHEDAALPTSVKLVPGGKLNFFEACKYSFITYLIDVGDDGLPQWPWPFIVLFYGLLAVALAMAFPFVLGKVLAEWSSQEMRFDPSLVPAAGQPIPGVKLIPARQAVFAPWEKAYYLACMASGLGLWVWWWYRFLGS